MAGLQVNPATQLAFTAAVGADSPCTLTLFNPHPVERLAFKIKTTASSTYRVWPNSGSLEAGETARVQVLLLGSKVDLADPRRLEECSHDRFQVQYMPLAEGQAFDNALFKLYAGLVRDIKLGVAVMLVDSLEPATAPEEASPWEGMVRIALMRMMADEEREPQANAACLTKFAELLVLNGIITTEQMWSAFNLVGDMYQTSGREGQKVMSKVEQWLEHPDFLNVGDPDAGSESESGSEDVSSGSDGGSSSGSDGSADSGQSGGEPRPLRTPHDRREAVPISRRNTGGEESYPNSPLTRGDDEGSVSDGVGDQPDGQIGRDGGAAFAFSPLETRELVAEEAAAADARRAADGNAGFEDAREQKPSARSGQSAAGFGSAQQSGSGGRSPSVSDAEDVSLDESAAGQLKDVAQLAGDDDSGSGSTAAGDDDDSLAAGMAEVHALAAGSGQQEAAADSKGQPRVLASFAAAREAAIAAAAAAEPGSNKRLVTPVRVSLKERKAALAQKLEESGADLDLDEAFAPEMLAEARAQMANAGMFNQASVTVPPTGPHMLSFADRAAMYGAIAGGRSGSGNLPNGAARPATGPAAANGRRPGGAFERLSAPAAQQSTHRRQASAGAAAAPSGFAAFQRPSRGESERPRRSSDAAAAAGRGNGNPSHFARPSGDTAGYSRPSGAESSFARPSGAESSPYARNSGRESDGYGREPPAGIYSRDSGRESSAAGYARDSGGYSAGFARGSGPRGESLAPRSSERGGSTPGRRPAPGKAAEDDRAGEIRMPPIEQSRRRQLSIGDDPRVDRAAAALAAAQLQQQQRRQQSPSPAYSDVPDSSPPTPQSTESDLPPAVRVLLPGKQSLTRREVAAVANGLRTSGDAGPGHLRSPSTGRQQRPSRSGVQVAPDSEQGTPESTPRKEQPAAAGRSESFPNVTGGAAPVTPPSPAAAAAAVAAGSGSPAGRQQPLPAARKNKGMFKKIGAAISKRAEEAARSAAGGGYYYV